MTDLTRLKVSLTKHGAHKIARLLKHFPAADVLAKTHGAIADVNINRAQAATNMSAKRDGTLPEVWKAAQDLGGGAIDAITMMAISFSHHNLIEVLRKSGIADGRGVVTREQLSSKAFTNFKNDVVELGFSKQSSDKEFSYDFSNILNDGRLGPLVKQIFSLKLKRAGWDEKNELVEECIAQHFHEALAISEKEFRSWFADLGDSGVTLQKNQPSQPSDPDEEIEPSEFVFRSGHKPKARQGAQRKPKASPEGNVELVHNQLQTKLHHYLVGEYGAKSVGTEQNTGFNSSIDVVVKSTDGLALYELKVGSTARQCIREALPQLLEYAYWGKLKNVGALIVVSPCEPTELTKQYLKRLRKEFNLPLYYQRIDETSGKLFSAV